MKGRHIKVKDIVKLLVFLSIGILLIWVFVRKLTHKEIEDIISSLRNVKFKWLFLAFVFGVISVIARASRWVTLIEPLGYKPKYSSMFFSVLVAYLANLAIPRLGEVSRCGVLAKYEKIPFEKSFGTVITERVFDLIVFFLLLIVNIILQYKTLEIYINTKILARMQIPTGKLHIPLILCLITFFVVLVFIIVIKKFPENKFFSKIKKILNGLWGGIKSITQVKRPGAFIFHTVLLWTCYFFMTRLVFFGLTETAHLGNDAAFSSLVFSTIGNILVQGGIGIYPLIVAEVLNVYNCSKAIGYTAGWLIWINQTALIIFGGVVAFIVLPLINKDRKDKVDK